VTAPTDLFDLYVSGKNSTPAKRADLTKKLQPLFPLDAVEVAGFVASGARLKLKSGIDQGTAMQAILDLQAMGATAEIVPVAKPVPPPRPAPPPIQIAALPVLGGIDEVKDAAGSDGPGFVMPSDLSARLSALDGTEVHDDISEDPVRGPSLLHPPPLPDNPAPPAAPPPSDHRFGAPPALDTGIELELPHGMVKKSDAAPPPDEEQQIPKCLAHRQPEPCEQCEEAKRKIPGRLMQGALRGKPMLRLAIGIVLGLLVGYLAVLPYSNRAERRVAEVRAEANVDRYKNDPTLRRSSQALDAKAEEMASSAFYTTFGVWLLIAAALTGVWYRLT
jgi:hypothetical protein